MNYIIVSPVRNEGQYLGQTLQSIASQTIRPLKWVLVDDGSTDNTPEILREAASLYSWIQVVTRSDRGFRQSGIGVVQAFYEGFEKVESLPWDYVVKMDGDVRLAPDYFESLTGAFTADKRLGICSGDVFNEREGGELVLDNPNDPGFHVRGAAKMYSRACWEAIGGVPRVSGFDCVDNIKARMLGWDTKRLPRPAVIHLRHTGAANGVWRDSYKNGMAANAIGYHPLFLLLRCARILITRRSLVASLGMFFGYVNSIFADIPRIREVDLIRYLRRQQLNRIFGRESIWN